MVSVMKKVIQFQITWTYFEDEEGSEIIGHIMDCMEATSGHPDLIRADVSTSRDYTLDELPLSILNGGDSVDLIGDKVDFEAQALNSLMNKDE